MDRSWKSLSPKQNNAPHSFHTPKKWRRFPPSERQWEDTLRGESVPKSKKSPVQKQSTYSMGTNELNAAISASVAELRKEKSAQSVQVQGNSEDSGKAWGLQDYQSVDRLLKAAEDVKQKWSQRQSQVPSQTSTLTPNSRKRLVERMIERTRNRANGQDSNLRNTSFSLQYNFDTEPSHRINTETTEERSLSPSTGRVVQTEESPERSSFFESEPKIGKKTSPFKGVQKQDVNIVKRLKEELKSYKAKYRKVEEMYAVLLTRKDHSDPTTYKKLYEDLQRKHLSEHVLSTQKQWETQIKHLEREVAAKTQECRYLHDKLEELRSAKTANRDGNMLAALMKEVEDLKTRVTKNEQENQEIRTQVSV